MQFNCPGHLFAARTVNLVQDDDGTEMTLEWPEGSWGLAPNGTYVDSDNYESEVSTSVVGNVVIMILSFETPVAGNRFSGTNPDDAANHIDGTISDDLTTIEFTETTASGSVYEVTLTLLE